MFQKALIKNFIPTAVKQIKKKYEETKPDIIQFLDKFPLKEGEESVVVMVYRKKNSEDFFYGLYAIDAEGTLVRKILEQSVDSAIETYVNVEFLKNLIDKTND